jgi:hypothetical protein
VQPAETLAQIDRLVRQHLFLDFIQRLGDSIGDAVHGIGDIFDDGFQ